MGWPGLDQRAFPRYSAQCDITIIEKSEIIKTKTQNIGVGGVCVILKKALEKLSQVSLHLVLNEELHPIEYDARVVWVIPSKELASSKVNYDTGLEFINLNAADRELIESFIQKLSHQRGR